MSGVKNAVKIKICGLSRPCDIDFVNEAKPDYCGFVIGVPGSRRNVTPEQLRHLRPRLDGAVTPVGVFVNAPAEMVASLLQDGSIAIAQLHGQEDEAYMKVLRGLTEAPVIQAFSIAEAGDIERAEQSSADFVLLDHGAGGTGEAFDWGLLGRICRPYFLAGGLTPGNLPDALRTADALLRCVDLSSGVETGGYKDKEKITAAVAAVRRWTDE